MSAWPSVREPTSCPPRGRRDPQSQSPGPGPTSGRGGGPRSGPVGAGAASPSGRPGWWVGRGSGGGRRAGLGGCGAGCRRGRLPPLAGLPAMGHRRLVALLRRWSPAEAWRRVGDGRGTTATPLADCGARRRGHRRRRSRLRLRRAGVGVLSFDRPPTRRCWPTTMSRRGSCSTGAIRPSSTAGGWASSAPAAAPDTAGSWPTSSVATWPPAGCGWCRGWPRESTAPPTPVPWPPRAAPPIAVVGSGVDVVYPRRNAQLWADVAAAGLLLNEAPLGAAPEPWRFPVRNRVIAALSEVVVVVESHARGGSKYTVDAAAQRGRTVMAVPGSVPQSGVGVHQRPPGRRLPAGGDVYLTSWWRWACRRPAARAARGRRGSPPLSTGARRPVRSEAKVLDASGWEAASLEGVVLRSGRVLTGRGHGRPGPP